MEPIPSASRWLQAIDRHNAGKLCLARGAYNKVVAGVVSGAS